MQPLVFTTSALSPKQHFEAFRAAHEAFVDIAVTEDARHSFEVSQRVWSLEKLVLSGTVLPRMSESLRWRHWRDAPLDHWYIVLPCRIVEGQVIHRQPEASPRVYSLGRQTFGEIEGDALTLFIPRDLLPSCALDDLVDRPLDHGIGRLLADMMIALHNRLPGLEAADLAAVVEATRCLLGACAKPTADRLAQAQAPIELALLERARRLIRHRLAAPDLSPETLCKELGVSRSRLYRLFQPLGGIASFIRHQRLLKTRHALLDPAEARSIAKIGELWGFPDPSCFSRSYRHEFGLSPKEARDLGRSEGWQRRHTGTRPDFCGQGPGIAELLRQLSA